jgi:phosphoribosylamine---glycine ligase
VNVLLIDFEGFGLHLARLAVQAGHSVRLWCPRTRAGKRQEVGDGFEGIEKPAEWQSSMKWADLVLPTDNAHYIDDLEGYFVRGFPIFGCNRAGAQLELDRVHGLSILQEYGVRVNGYEAFSSYDKAISFVLETGKAYASKPLGDGAKGLSYVAKSPADLVFKLKRWKKKNELKNGFLLQELVKGHEMAIGGWFGPGGWSGALCENWEEKRLMNDGLGVNTGEQGTVVRYVRESKLFREVLQPLTEYLHRINYVGYVDLNCMVKANGEAVPLEWTTRFGWPLYNIQAFLHKDDPVEWMLDALHGQDTLKTKEDVAVGVVISHGDYPYGHLPPEMNSGYPLDGIDSAVEKSLAFVKVMRESAPIQVGAKVVDMETFVTAGDYIAVATGLGKTVKEAMDRAYKIAWSVDLPSNRMFRTDIGKRLDDDLGELHRHGFAVGLRF